MSKKRCHLLCAAATLLLIAHYVISLKAPPQERLFDHADALVIFYDTNSFAAVIEDASLIDTVLASIRSIDFYPTEDTVLLTNPCITVGLSNKNLHLNVLVDASGLCRYTSDQTYLGSDGQELFLYLKKVFSEAQAEALFKQN